MEMVTSLTTLPSRALLPGALLVGLVMALLAAPQPASAAAFGITTPAGQLFPGPATITGEKEAGSTVAVDGAACVEVDAEHWSCDLALADGNHTVTATETLADLTVGATATVAIRVLGAPTITTTGLTTGTINGTGYPGAGIEISGDIGKSCGAVLPNGSWSCSLGVGTGTYSVSATQTWGNVPFEPGGSTAATTITVDTDAPTVPAFSSPGAGSRVTSQPTVFSGSGENGGRVEVFVDSTRVCVSPVISGQWSCTSAVADGQHTVQGIQWDAAGNPSGASSGYAITVGAPVEPVAPIDPPRNQNPAPAAPLQPVTPAPLAPFLPPPVGGESGLPPFDTWEVPTDYGAAIPSATATNPTSWLLGLGLGLGFALLVALPLRLLVTTYRRRRGYVPREVPEEEPILGPKLTAALFLAAAVLLAALAGGIQAEVRYLRLMIAIGLALAVLNCAALLAAKLAGRAIGVSTGIRLAPLMLVIAAVTALVSRVAGIQPPIIVGIVLAVRFAPAIGARARGLVSLAGVSVVVVVGFIAWLAQSALGPVEGFFPSLVSEALAALTIASLGSAMVMLLPVHRMPGRQIWAWSRPAWAALTLVTATVAGVVIAGGSGFPAPWVIGGALVFTAVSIGAWAWMRFLQPFAAVGGSN
jgi:hypothetical protein